jgi:hypothetical protein
LSGVVRCWHSNAYFSLFSSLFFFDHRTDLSRFRGTFHSFDFVGFAIFAIRVPSGQGVENGRTRILLMIDPRRATVARLAFVAPTVPASESMRRRAPEG